MMRFLAWAVVRLSFLLVPAWILMAAAAVHWLPPISGADESPLGGLVPGHAAAVRTEVREARRFGTTLLTRVVVVQRDEHRLSKAQVRGTLRLAARIDRRRAPLLRHIRFVAPLVSRDHTTTVSYLYYEPSISTGARLALADTYAKRLHPPGRVTGALPARVEEFDHIERALPYVTLATVALIVLVLLITFRAIGPPLVGLGAAAIAYTISVRALAWIGEQRGQEVPKEVQPVLVALLLGLVTDYSIFFMAGMRRRLAAGAGRFEAAEQTARDNLPIVLTAGLIVALGSLTLVAGQLDVFHSFGPGIAVAVAISLAVALTFIPGVLALLGPALFWPTLRRGERERRNRPLRFLGRRSWAAVAAIVVVAVLGVAAAETSNMRLGFTLLRGQPPDSAVKRGAEDAGRGFGAGIVAPSELLLERRALKHKQLVSLQRELARQPGVQRVLGPADQPTGTTLPVFVARDRDAARYALVLRAEPLSASAIDILEGLQDRMPQLLARSGIHEARVGYGGDTALAQQTVTAIRDDALRVGIAVLAVNFVLLALFLRALGAPLYLLVASVLALAAALGVTTWVFQDLLGHDDLTYYVPFAAGVLLLSLGSDYNVFVVGRIWQEARDRELLEAIAVAVPRASRTITVAGLTLAGSFALLALVPIRPLRELAFVMSFGILLDTFIVRSLLVPSLLALLGRKQRREPPQELRDRERPAHA